MATASHDPHLPFENSYSRLPEMLFRPVTGRSVKAPALVALNEGLAGELGLDADWLRSEDGLAMLAGVRFPESARPLAQAYAGHQFGNWVPQLGDGRALLIGEVIDAGGKRRDIHLKGSGRTPFSRGGDGNAALGPVVREYIMCEAMAALGVPTTRALAAVTTGETVVRERPLPGAVFARVGASHIRVGTFQYVYARKDFAALKALADHAIARHDPDLEGADAPYLGLLERVIERQARLIAQWLGIGFIHGVMNTDNMTVSGETIDYGPCAFMDAHDPAQVYSSIDQFGRYAYANQPSIAQWNLAQFAQALLPLIDEDSDKAIAAAQGALNRFPDLFEAAYTGTMRAKLGLASESDDDLELINDLLSRMAGARADFTNTFRALSKVGREPDEAEAAFVQCFGPDAQIGPWIETWRARLARETRSEADRKSAMLAVNPAYIPRNHRVEEAIAAAHDGDFGVMHRLNAVLANPWTEQDGAERYAAPPEPGEEVLATFCGT